MGTLTVNKTTPSITFSGRSLSGTTTLTAGHLNAYATNPYSGWVAQPTGSFTYTIVVASGDASPTSGIVTVGSVLRCCR